MNEKMTQILIIDDELDTISVAIVILKASGFTVDSFSDAKEGLKQMSSNPPDLLLLDLKLAGDDGFEVLKGLKSSRETKHIPIVMISAHANEANIVQGLELGADDFIQKPIRKKELLARVKAVLRRSESVAEEIERGRLYINVKAHLVKISETIINFQKKEFELFVLFARREGCVLTREKIISALWDQPLDPSSRAIDVLINEMRKKLGVYGTCIKSIRGVGYRFEMSE